MGMYKKDTWFYKGNLGEDMILDTKVLERLLDIKLSTGLNNVVYIATSDVFPCLSKGLKIEVKFDVILPSNHSDLCLYVKNTFALEGRGAKSNQESLTDRFFLRLMDKDCIYNYHKDKFPEFIEGASTQVMLLDAQRDGAYKAKYLTVDHIKFNEDITYIKDLSDLKSSTKEKAIIYIKSADKRENEETYMIYENGLYEKNNKTYVDDYKDCMTYYSEYSGLDHRLIISNIGYWIKVRDLSQVDTIAVRLNLKEKGKYSEDKDVSAIVVDHEILFAVDEIDCSKGNDTWYYLPTWDKKIVLYRHNKDTNITVRHSEINGEPVFDTDIEPENSSDSQYDTGYLTCGLYIKSEFELNGEKKSMILAPVSLSYLKDFSKHKVNGLKIYIYEDHLYGLVGEYDKIGFILDTRSWTWTGVNVSEIPQNEHSSFFFSYEELQERLSKYSNKKAQKIERFIPFDARFEKSRFELKEGDEIVVIDEPTEISRIHGLKGIVTEISDNRQIVTINFLNFFTEKLSIECIDKVIE